MEHFQSLPARGALAGFAGATTLALWFLVLDAGRGEPLSTVSALANLMTGRPDEGLGAGVVSLYTVIHYLLFMGVAVAVAWILDRLRTAPNLLYGFALGFILFDVAFYLGVGQSGGVVQGVGWPEVLGGNLLAGVVLVSVLRGLAPVKYRGWWEGFYENRIIREGVLVGIIGGGVVALWFLLQDALAGRPLYTPAALGSALLLGSSDPSQVTVGVTSVVGYSLIHFGTFILSGLVAAAIIAQAERRPNMILLGGLLFVTFVAFLMAALALFAEWMIGSLAWWNVALGNLFATLAMAGFLLRAHPKIRLALGEEALTVRG